ncbi:MAG: hypothetical protein ACJAR0_004319 [Candidatus Azotimanducaceae bacterium]
MSLSEDPDNLLVAVSALLHGNSLLGAPYSQVSTGPKNGRQVTSCIDHKLTIKSYTSLTLTLCGFCRGRLQLT